MLVIFLIIINQTFFVKVLPIDIEVKTLEITIVGDLNFSKNRIDVFSSGASVYGSIIPFSDFTVNIKGLIDGDINYCNLESAVLENNTLGNIEKQYCFKTHINGVEHLCDIGFNLFGLGNNHVGDYNRDGVKQTVDNFKNIANNYDIYYSGAGYNLEEAIAPVEFEINGKKIAFSSIGITGLPATARNAGISATDYYIQVIDNLSNTESDYKILAVHAGQERNPTVSYIQQNVFNYALGEKDINLVIGTHPHIAQGVEIVDNNLGFYCLGNFLMLGAANMASVSGSLYKKDFGLMGKIYLSENLEVDSVIIIPIYDMHYIPHQIQDSVGVTNRIERVNEVSSPPYLHPVGRSVTFVSNGVRGIFIP